MFSLQLGHPVAMTPVEALVVGLIVYFALMAAVPVAVLALAVIAAIRIAGLMAMPVVAIADRM